VPDANQSAVRDLANYLEVNRHAPLTTVLLEEQTPPTLPDSQLPVSLINEFNELKNSQVHSEEGLALQEKLIQSVQDSLETIEFSAIADREKLLEMSVELAAFSYSESANALLLHQADRYSASSNPAIEELGKKAYQSYLNAESNGSIRELKTREFNEARDL
jgi:hypothetical protein